MGQSLPKPALRPMLAEDAPMLAAIFVASIEELTGDDYSEAQQEAWVQAAEDDVAFGKRLAGIAPAFFVCSGKTCPRPPAGSR